MQIRPFRIPEDASIVAETLPLMFQYPDHPEWSLDQSEAEMMTETMAMVSRLSLLFKILYITSSRVRDLISGLVCEEDGKVVGLSNILRMGSSDTWMLANVGVLPDYRRRGIARKLVEGSVAMIRERGGKQAVLAVIDGNTPAYDLYQSLGFQRYDAEMELDYTQPDPPKPVSLPDGYTTQVVPRRKWQFRYELAKRIMPPVVQRYVPVTVARYRVGTGMLMLESLVTVGLRSQSMVIYDAAKRPVATMRFSARTRPGGVNSLNISLDPAHAVLAPYIIERLLTTVTRMSPGRRISVQLQEWETALVEAALSAGFTKRMAAHMMGLVF